LLKKENKELKSYFTELGLEATAVKDGDKDDLLVSSVQTHKEKAQRKKSKDLEGSNQGSENVELVG